MRMFIIGLLAIMAVIFTTLLPSQTTPVKGAPVGDPVAGKAFWGSPNVWCNRCHGPNGEGAFGPDLAGRGLGYEHMLRAIRQPWGIMPAFTEKQISDKNIADLAAYFASLPPVAEPGPWRTAIPEGAPLGQQLLIGAYGCGQCHGAVHERVRQGLGAINADFDYFKGMVYNHTDAFPTGRMGNSSRIRVPEDMLLAIYRWDKEDLGFRVPLTAILTAASPAGDRATYILTLENRGTSGKGLPAGEIYISLKVPQGSSLTSASSHGFQGTQHWAPGGYDIAVWLIPQVAAGDKLPLTIEVQGTGASSGSHAYVHWLAPTRGGEEVITPTVRPR